MSELLIIKVRRSWDGGLVKRYRYCLRPHEDLNVRAMESMDKFKFKYSEYLNAEDIAKVKERWKHKLIEEN